jgi:hypothetical protein
MDAWTGPEARSRPTASLSSVAAGPRLSYLYFDRCFTRELVELGRADAERAHDQILSLLGGACAVAA